MSTCLIGFQGLHVGSIVGESMQKGSVDVSKMIALKFTHWISNLFVCCFYLVFRSHFHLDKRFNGNGGWFPNFRHHKITIYLNEPKYFIFCI